MTADSSTIANNTTTNGPGAGISSAGAGTSTLNNSIVAGNTGSGDLDGTFDAGFDLIENTTGATINDLGNNITGQDANLGALADNGGPTKTMLPQGGSPVLDQGDSALTTDQRGFTRPVDLPGVTPGPGNQADMGAVEVQVLTNTAPPSISGTAAFDDTLSSPYSLTAFAGAWQSSSGQPTFHYQWLRCDADGSSCTPVGEDKLVYVLTADDIGSTIRVDVTAEAGGLESSPARSAPTARVAVAGPLTITGVTKDKKKGTAQITVRVPGPGSVELTGEGNVRAAAPVDVSAVGQTVTFDVRAKGRAAKRLKRLGRAKVHPHAVLHPVVGPDKPAKTVFRLRRR